MTGSAKRRHVIGMIFMIATFLPLASHPSLANPLTPIETVKLFDTVYGGPEMDQIADHTTAKFRDDKPKAVWIVDTWRALHELEYVRLGGSVVDSKVKDDKAVVIMDVKIKTKAGEVSQKEVYYQLSENE